MSIQKRKLGYVWTLVVVALISCGINLQAQTFTASVQGTVKDQTAAVVPGAALTVSSPSTGLVRTTTSNEAGHYLVPALIPGAYQVEVAMPGFKTETASIVLQVNQSLRLDFTLEVGHRTENVTVESTTDVVDTADATIGHVMEQKRIEDLPLNGRNFLSLSMLTSGVENRQSTRGLLSTNGTRSQSIGFLFDGVDGNDLNAIFQGLSPSVEAIQEFQIQTSTYSAEFGRNAGAQINLISRGGDNQFRGTAFEYLRNSAFDAKNFFVSPGNPIPPFRRNQFGAIFSGPIRKDKTFFLVNYEGTRQAKALTIATTVPTQAQKNGDFSASGIILKDPLTKAPFLNDQIPSGRIDPAGSKLAALYPNPNLSSGSNNFVSSPSDHYIENKFMARVDDTISNKDQLFGRYFFTEDRETNPFAQVPGGYAGTTIPGFPTYILHRGQNLSLNWTHTFTPRLVAEYRFGVFRYDAARHQDASIDGITTLGIAGEPNVQMDHGYPLVSVTGFPTLGNNTDLPQDRPQNTFHVFATLSYEKSQHHLKMGFELRREQQNLTIDSGVRGTFTFTGASTGNALGDLLLGLPNAATLTNNPEINALRSSLYGAYFQDDWKVAHQLTLNLGLRYDYWTPPTDKYGNLGGFNFATQQVVPVGTLGSGAAGYNPDRNNFGPRFGFAFTPFASLSVFVIRGGYGIYYDTEDWNTLERPQWFLYSITVNSPPSIENAYVTPTAPPIRNTYAIEPQFRNAYYGEWNLQVETALRKDLGLSVSYIGSKGTKLPNTRDLNQSIPGSGSGQSRRPLSQWGSITYLYSGDSSIYHSMQARLEKRFSGGMSFLGVYTFSKSIDNADLYEGSAQNSYDTNSARALSNFDARQRFTGSFLYELPFGKDKVLLKNIGRVGSAFISGWQLNGIVQVAAGNPFTPVVSQDITGTLQTNSTHPNRVCDGAIDNPSPSRWFDPGCFTIPAAGMYGNAGRSILIGPGLKDLDTSLFKTFKIGDRQSLEFRAEFFNVLNHPNFGQPNATIDAPKTVGVITATSVDNRDIQFALKYIF